MNIRPIRFEEIPILRNFLYDAIYQRDESNLLPRSILEQPEIKVYIENFGERDDHCLVALDGDAIVGAAWARILSGPVKGLGNIDGQTPEFAISVLKEHRGKGIGTSCLVPQ